MSKSGERTDSPDSQNHDIIGPCRPQRIRPSDSFSSKESFPVFHCEPHVSKFELRPKLVLLEEQRTRLLRVASKALGRLRWHVTNCIISMRTKSEGRGCTHPGCCRKRHFQLQTDLRPT